MDVDRFLATRAWTKSTRATYYGAIRAWSLWLRRGSLTAAKILGETADVDGFKSKDAYARHNGTAPLPVWSSNKANHRLSRTGNRQLNADVHRIAMTQALWRQAAQ